MLLLLVLSLSAVLVVRAVMIRPILPVVELTIVIEMSGTVRTIVIPPVPPEILTVAIPIIMTVFLMTVTILPGLGPIFLIVITSFRFIESWNLRYRR